MILVAHRINKSKYLKKIPKIYGIEIDVRDYLNDIIVEHDPFKKGEKLEKYLNNFNHKLLIVNIKSERIEYRVKKILEKKKIKNYFFLDSSFPMILDLIKNDVNNVAVRVTDYESINTAIKLKKKIKWVWFETTGSLKKSFFKFKKLKKLKFKICLVSNELHKKKFNFSKKNIEYLIKNKLIDAVCAKYKKFSTWH